MSFSLATFLFFASFSIVLYVIAGYPLLLSLLARKVRPWKRGDALKPVSILIPVHNGEHYLRKKLDSVLALRYPLELMELVVISDGSTDRTEAIAESYSECGVKLIHIHRGGKGAALNAGIARTKNEILVLTDVRQELEPESLLRLISCFADPEVGVVSGTLIIRDGTAEDQRNVGLYWRYESWIRSKLSSIDSMLGATGPFYAIRRELAVPLPCDILLDDMYLPLAAFFRGYRLVAEEGARALDIPTSAKTEFRRKVRTLAGNYQILRFWPQLLSPRNRMWFHYLSYKVGRLVLPFALIAAVAATLYLPSPWELILGSAEAVFCLLAVVDHIVPSGTRVKRFSSPAYTFLTMMTAALCALPVLFLPPRRLWKVTGASAPN